MQKDKNFFNDVYEVVKLIPRGKITTYGAIGKYLGTAKSARMVGWALNACQNRKDVPAHRVVNKSGLLTGKFYFSTFEEMEKLLKKEGIKISNNQIDNFNKHFWDPSENLSVE